MVKASFSLADCNLVHDAHSAFKCREEDRPETIMAEFCKADFGRWETMDVSTLLSKICVSTVCSSGNL